MILSTALLESVEARDRPLAIGVATMCQTPSAIYGPLGGVLTQATSYPTVFALSAVAGLVGWVAAWRIGANQLAAPPTVQETGAPAAN
jgi:predicted MFS family arabinose efflux permease